MMYFVLSRFALSGLLFTVVCLPLISSGAVPLRASPLILAWYPSPDPTVAGYAIYYGPANQPATNRMDTGKTQRATFTNLQAGLSYNFYAVSYGPTGLESLPSNAILISPPVLSRAQLTRQSNKWQVALRAAPGTVCRVEYADAPVGATWRTLTNVTANSLGEVIALDSTTNNVAARYYRAALVTVPPVTTRLKLAKQPNGTMRITLSGSPGTTWRVQRASTPTAAQWTTMGSVTNNEVGEATLTDTTAAQTAVRFYRAVTP